MRRDIPINLGKALKYKVMHLSIATEEKLQELDEELDKLRLAYEQYFSGISRIQPVKENDDFKRKLQNFRLTDLVSTSQRFKYTNTKSRYHQLNTMWQKMCKQIEEGTFVRERILNKIKSHLDDEAPSADTANKSSQENFSSKEEKALEALYTKLQGSKKNAKALAKEKFMEVMKKQLDSFKSKYPNTAFRFRLSKDQKGQTKVLIEKKS